eukprot:356221-Chlamydomonas_euryale.AAC.1
MQQLGVRSDTSNSWECGVTHPTAGSADWECHNTGSHPPVTVGRFTRLPRSTPPHLKPALAAAPPKPAPAPHTLAPHIYSRCHAVTQKNATPQLPPTPAVAATQSAGGPEGGTACGARVLPLQACGTP